MQNLIGSFDALALTIVLSALNVGVPAQTAVDPDKSGNQITPDWNLMNWAERNDHRNRMRSIKNYDVCKTYMAQHREKMAKRSSERGRGILQEPVHDSCDVLKR